MLNEMQPVLEFVVAEINKVNESRNDEITISQDGTNEELLNIFQEAVNTFAEIDFDIVDDEDELCELFGYDGYYTIRQAEQDLV